MDELRSLWVNIMTTIEGWWNTSPEWLVVIGAALAIVAFISLTKNNPHRRVRR